MARVKTLYVRDEDAVIWEKAAKVAAKEGASLSEFVTAAVRTRLENQPPATNFRLLSAKSLKVVAHGTAIAQTTHFEGRWLVSNARSSAPGESSTDVWSIAVTKGGAFVAQVLRGGRDPELAANRDLNGLQRIIRIPADIIAAALTVLSEEGWVVHHDF